MATEDNFLQPEDDTQIGVTNPDEFMPGLAGYVKSKFEDAENGRYSHEQRWLQAYKNFRGIYDSTTQYRDSERSKVFVRITKTKVLAAFGQIIDILFTNKKFPLVVESTPVPEGIAEFAHMETPLDQITQQDPYGFAGDGRELRPGAMQAEQPKAFLGGLQGEYGQLPLVEGKAKLGEPQISPAQEAARRMEKTIHDQLLDTNAVNVLRKSIFEASLFGTGIVKGPFNFNKRVHKWERDDNGEREYSPYERVVPRIEMVSLWDFHPDPSATCIEDCEYVIERHRFNRQQLRSLIKRPHFISSAIEECLAKVRTMRISIMRIPFGKTRLRHTTKRIAMRFWNIGVLSTPSSLRKQVLKVRTKCPSSTRFRLISGSVETWSFAAFSTLSLLPVSHTKCFPTK